MALTSGTKENAEHTLLRLTSSLEKTVGFHQIKNGTTNKLQRTGVVF